MRRVAIFWLAVFTLTLGAVAKPKKKDASTDPWRVFSVTDRRHITDCYAGGGSGLPPGLAKKDRLPPGLEKQLRRNGKLPPGLQKKIQPLPAHCQVNLPRLPAGWERVIYQDRVILLDPARRVIDYFQMVLNRAAGRPY
jgi:hypothetical protein